LYESGWNERILRKESVADVKAFPPFDGNYFRRATTRQPFADILETLIRRFHRNSSRLCEVAASRSQLFGDGKHIIQSHVEEVSRDRDRSSPSSGL